MIIITKTTVEARRHPVSLEQAAMTRKRLRFADSWRCNNWCISASTSPPSSTLSATIKMFSYKNHINKLQKRVVDQHRHFLAILLIGIVFLVNCPTSAVAASKNPIPRSASIASNDNSNRDQRLLHHNWFEFQKQSLDKYHRNQYQAADLGSILSQLGIFIQSRQRNASELAGNIFFKYYNT